MFHLVLSNKQSDCRGHPVVPVNPGLPVVLPLALVLGWFCPVSSCVQGRGSCCHCWLPGLHVESVNSQPGFSLGK